MLEAEVERLEAESALKALELEELEIEDSMLAEAITNPSPTKSSEVSPALNGEEAATDWVEDLVGHGFSRKAALWGFSIQMVTSILLPNMLCGFLRMALMKSPKSMTRS